MYLSYYSLSLYKVTIPCQNLGQVQISTTDLVKTSKCAQQFCFIFLELFDSFMRHTLTDYTMSVSCTFQIRKIVQVPPQTHYELRNSYLRFPTLYTSSNLRWNWEILIIINTKIPPFRGFVPIRLILPSHVGHFRNTFYWESSLPYLNLLHNAKYTHANANRWSLLYENYIERENTLILGRLNERLQSIHLNGFNYINLAI